MYSSIINFNFKSKFLERLEMGWIFLFLYILLIINYCHLYYFFLFLSVHLHLSHILKEINVVSNLFRELIQSFILFHLLSNKYFYFMNILNYQQFFDYYIFGIFRCLYLLIFLHFYKMLQKYQQIFMLKYYFL
jgi:hypothetical protein